MAYNPFNIFRRNQKTIFAVITVFIMFTFVLSSGMGGGNDFFDWFPRWFGTKTKKGDQLCTIAGSRVYEQDLQQVRLQRLIAKRFMELASQQALQNLQRSMIDLQSKATPQFVAQIMSTARQMPQQLPAMLKMMRGMPQITESDKLFLDTLQASNDLQFSVMVNRGFIAPIDTAKSRDVVEFMLWEKKADQLGIQFTDEDIDQLVKKELRQPIDDRPIRQALKDMRGFSMEACRKALKAEFRVRAAQTERSPPLRSHPLRTIFSASTGRRQARPPIRSSLSRPRTSPRASKTQRRVKPNGSSSNARILSQTPPRKSPASGSRGKSRCGGSASPARSPITGNRPRRRSPRARWPRH